MYGARLRLGFGDSSDNNGMSGNLDDFRITKGAGRYDAANFTPPTQGFATTATPTYKVSCTLTPNCVVAISSSLS